MLPLKYEIEDLPQGPAITLAQLRELLDQMAAAVPPPTATPPVVVSPSPTTAIPAVLDPRSYTITQRIGEQLTGYNTSPHSGVDYAMPEGAPVAALRHGVVIFAAYSDALTGNLVAVRYDDGVIAYFAHLSSVGATYVGQEVWPDTTIGFIGHTGSATGPHLHLELHTEGGHLGTLDALLDPISYFA